MKKDFDIVIIGMGPAGVSASLYTQRAGMATLIIGLPFQGCDNMFSSVAVTLTVWLPLLFGS